MSASTYNSFFFQIQIFQVLRCKRYEDNDVGSLPECRMVFKVRKYIANL